MDENEFKIYHLNKKLKHLFEDIIGYQKKADNIISELKNNFSWERFEKLFLGKTESKTPVYSDVFSALLSYKDQLNQEERIKSATSYQTTHNALLKYIKTQEKYIKLPILTFEEITPEFLLAFEKHMRGIGLSTSTVGIYMRNIRSIFNKAITQEKVISAEAYPFGRGKYSPPSSINTKKSLKMEDIGKIFNYIGVSEIEQWAKDMWIFIYLGNGMNIKDLAYLKYKNIQDGEIKFIRAKSKNSIKEKEKRITIVLTDEMNLIIDKWGNKNKGENEYIFDLLKKGASIIEDYKAKEQAVKTINKYLKRIAENLHLSRKPTTNFARHSYATVLKRAGIPIEMISEQLGHTTVKTTEIYLDSFEKEQRKETVKHLTAFK